MQVLSTPCSPYKDIEYAETEKPRSSLTVGVAR